MEFPPPPAAASALWSGHSPLPEKSCRILIREHPRAIAIVSSSYALILRHSPITAEAIASGSLPSVATARTSNGNGDSPTAKCMAEFSPVSDKLLADYRSLTPRPIYGTLGLISVNGDVFLCVITQAVRVATVRPGEMVEKIESTQFFCLTSAEFDDIVLSHAESEMEGVSAYGQNLDRKEGAMEHPCQELQKLLSNGTFYYSTDFDLTNRMQDRWGEARHMSMCWTLG